LREDCLFFSALAFGIRAIHSWMLVLWRAIFGGVIAFRTREGYFLVIFIWKEFWCFIGLGFRRLSYFIFRV
jgi:hypothetical protein